MTIYETFTTGTDLASAVASLEVRALARVIGRDPGRENYPELTTRELAQAVIKEATKRTLAQYKQTWYNSQRSKR